MKHQNLLRIIGCVAASIALGILIQIFLPNILIIALCCILVIVMGLVIAKFI
ncbi:MAG: hypothetical protein IJD09_02365 [Clostridia bacterium]|nr:hypothetical protein [Clostridia bacterium]